MTALGELRGPDFGRPLENVLEKMAMNRAQMLEVKAAGGDAFVDALRDHKSLEGLQMRRIGQA
jgi:hypothetical protein